MKIIKNIFELNKAIKNYKNISFVPTMGGIHNGHKSLIKASQARSMKTIVSIFVNPTQFNEKADFNNYPRNFKRDIKILKKLKVEYLFMPQINEIYKKKMKKFILKKSEKILCAKFRKGHFEGVLDVMNRLLYIIKSKNVFMGKKDFQQYLLIKKILGKKYKINVIGCQTVRDKNEVALSTRNKLLNKNSINKASKIALKLIELKRKSKLNNLKMSINLSKIKSKLEKKYKIKIDYLEFRDEKNLKLNNFKSNYRLFIAYNINNVRLIDNF
tara:strand:- start:2901 stop:3713 length:813 start_codon:yes stop_codon:yes gene_type:complete